VWLERDLYRRREACVGVQRVVYTERSFCRRRESSVDGESCVYKETCVDGETLVKTDRFSCRRKETRVDRESHVQTNRDVCRRTDQRSTERSHFRYSRLHFRPYMNILDRVWFSFSANLVSSFTPALERRLNSSHLLYTLPKHAHLFISLSSGSIKTSLVPKPTYDSTPAAAAASTNDVIVIINRKWNISTCHA
jgi:hypothetical protein